MPDHEYSTPMLNLESIHVPTVKSEPEPTLDLTRESDPNYSDPSLDYLIARGHLGHIQPTVVTYGDFHFWTL